LIHARITAQKPGVFSAPAYPCGKDSCTPSGDPKPSRDDIEMTREIKTAAEALGIVIHDHLVIGRKGHASFRSLGLLT
jgi:hypothetical protein